MADSLENTYQRAIITQANTQKLPSPEGNIQNFYTQEVTFRLLGATETQTISYGSEFQPITQNQLLRVGQTVIVQPQPETHQATTQYHIVDTYRLTPWFFLVGLFLILVFLVAKWRGILSVIGMTLTIGVLVLFLIPALLQGYDPLLVSILGSIALAAITLYVTHGWSMSSHLAFGSVVSVLIIVGLLSYGAVTSMQLTGLGTEEALFLQFLSNSEVQVQGLLLGGILLGTLGVLDDIIVSQIAVVEELFATKPKIQFNELFQRSLRVGQTHVASLVNTLVLVYAGANLPLFLLFSQSSQPLWVTLNSELIMEEIVRTLAGSIGLVLAVPIATFLAAASFLFLPKIIDLPQEKKKKKPSHIHHH